MAHKELAQTLNDFVNVLVNEELEPIKLDLIRVENDLRAEFDKVSEKLENTGEVSKIVDEKFDTLKSAIEELAGRISDAIAEGLSEQEENYQKLDERVASLEKKLGNIASSFAN
jgi:predicted nuclease with TOPRIM domain